MVAVTFIYQYYLAYSVYSETVDSLIYNVYQTFIMFISIFTIQASVPLQPSRAVSLALFLLC